MNSPPQSPRSPHDLPSFGPDIPPSPILYLPFRQVDPGTDSTQDADLLSLSLHRALHDFQPITDDYATTPYAEAFNWDQLRLPEQGEREWYCVVFKSKRKRGSDSKSLYEADRRAHEEAVQNGGLIMYWYGTPDPETGSNLATCIWKSRRHAMAANGRYHHVKAMRLTAESFEYYNLERHVLRKEKDQSFLTLQKFEGKGDVGW